MQKTSNDCQLVAVVTHTDPSQEETKGNGEKKGCLNLPSSPSKNVTKKTRTHDGHQLDGIATKLARTLIEDSPPLPTIKSLCLKKTPPDKNPPDVFRAFLAGRKQVACVHRKPKKPAAPSAPNQDDGIPWHLMEPAKRVELMDQLFPETPQNSPQGE